MIKSAGRIVRESSVGLEMGFYTVAASCIGGTLGFAAGTSGC